MLYPRRKFLRQTAALFAVPYFAPSILKKAEAAAAKISHLSPLDAADDEDFWRTIQESFTVTPNIINLNNGGVSPQPKVVQDAFVRYNEISNEGPAYFMWQVLGNERETVRIKLAELAGVSPEEIAINRNSTEALETIIYGIDLKPGDEILTSNQDYPNMLNALNKREKREGVVIKKVSIPVPLTDMKEVVEIYRKAITPKTKIILVCHMINLTGQILPVREIADIAHERGIEVICDGAHTFAHLDYRIPDLHCDYYGTSLHKWLCAPFGAGMLYVKKEKIKALWPMFGAPPDFNEEDIRKFEHLGTRSFPTELAIGNAIHFHNTIGSKRKEERLRYLKNYWAEKVSKFPKVKLNTNILSEHSCALANFTIEGMEPQQIYDPLFNKYKIYTTPIVHAEFKGIRVTPHVYTTLKDLDYFVSAVEEIARG